MHYIILLDKIFCSIRTLRLKTNFVASLIWVPRPSVWASNFSHQVCFLVVFWGSNFRPDWRIHFTPKNIWVLKFIRHSPPNSVESCQTFWIISVESGSP